jgi:hypothetical protein
MTDTDTENLPESELKPLVLQPLFTPEQSAFYLKAKFSWQQRWQAVIEQCSDCFIRY